MPMSAYVPCPYWPSSLIQTAKALTQRCVNKRKLIKQSVDLLLLFHSQLVFGLHYHRKFAFRPSSVNFDVVLAQFRQLKRHKPAFDALELLVHAMLRSEMLLNQAARPANDMSPLRHQCQIMESMLGCLLAFVVTDRALVPMHFQFVSAQRVLVTGLKVALRMGTRQVLHLLVNGDVTSQVQGVE